MESDQDTGSLSSPSSSHSTASSPTKFTNLILKDLEVHLVSDIQVQLTVRMYFLPLSSGGWDAFLLQKVAESFLAEVLAAF